MRLWIVLLCCAPLSAAELIVGITNSHQMPWVRLVNERVYDGLLVDLGHLLAQSLNHKARFVMVPRKRVEQLLQQHEIDFICNYRPPWFDEPQAVYWSGPVLRQGDVVVSLRERQLAVTADAMTRKKISMTLGYHYPELQQLMGTHSFERVDVKFEELTLQQVMNRKADYAVLNSYMFDWYVHQNPQHPFVAPTFISAFDFECAMSKQAPISANALIATTTQLREQQRFSALANKYGLKVVPR